jgi:hypothetical protein
MGGVPYLGAVIPSCVDDVGLTWLRSEPAGLTVALHGWNHGADRPEERDEFSGRVERDIRQRLRWGQIRVGPTPHLVPPYNALPYGLPEAAYHEDIRYIWGAEREWPAPPPPHELGRVWLIPAWAPLYGALRFKQAESPVVLDNLRALVGYTCPYTAVVVLHIPWEKSREPELGGVREFADFVRDYAITPDEYVEECCR